MKSTSWIVAALCCILAISACGAASAANIAWVTFHAADGTPSANAATAGFTQAPDVGYTNALTAAGHTVTRFVTKENPTLADLATLNASDLIIIGRSVASGNYQAANETLFWNTSITKPIINTGGYTQRGGAGGNSRLGFYTGSTIPDTGPTTAAGGPVRLQATNPSHPIFAGVALDGTNTMVNLYADVVNAPFAPNAPQRGISVVTNPIVAGGQVLATVNTAGDLANGGTVIALFPPGTMTAAATDPTPLGGYRLTFLTGTRENAANAAAVPPITALTSEGAGIYDLQPDGARMFLNAVNFMLAIPEPGTASLLMLAVVSFGLIRRR